MLNEPYPQMHESSRRFNQTGTSSGQATWSARRSSCSVVFRKAQATMDNDSKKFGERDWMVATQNRKACVAVDGGHDSLAVVMPK